MTSSPSSGPPSGPNAGAAWSVLTPRGVRGAAAVVGVRGENAAAALQHAGLRVPAVGAFGLRSLLGVDEGLVASWNASAVDLFPHGGPLIVRRLTERLTAAGLGPATAAGSADVGAARATYPEASSEIESLALHALAAAASPLAVDLLLAQPARWAAAGVTTAAEADARLASMVADASSLGALLRPPLVALVGPANVGKSTLTNALAGRTVALAADEAGTTRDHVGVTLELAGLTVRWLDTPGRRDLTDDGPAAAIERAARAAADAAVAAADLVVLCGDGLHPAPHVPWARSPRGVLRVALRADLGPAAWPHDLALAGRSPSGPGEAGLAALAGAVRERLVPRTARADPRPWRFWAEPEPGRP